MQSWRAAGEQVKLMNGDLCQRPMWRLSGDLTFTTIPESLHGPRSTALNQNPSIISRVKSVFAGETGRGTLYNTLAYEYACIGLAVMIYSTIEVWMYDHFLHILKEMTVLAT